MRIYNQGKDFMEKVNLGDKVIYRTNKLAIRDGIVKLISQRGINVQTEVGDRFVKWCNVISIELEDG
jgi:hypothetical protein